MESEKRGRPTDFFVNFLQKEKGSPKEKIEKLNSLSPEDSPLKFDIIDANGVSSLTGNTLELGERDHEQLKKFFADGQDRYRSKSDFPPPPIFGPLSPPPRFPLHLIPVENDSTHAYLIQFRMMPPPGGRHIFLITAAALLLAVLIAAALSIYILFHYFRQKSQTAQQVIQAIKDGDLKARFPISRIDDVSQIMGQFNIMADEIEKLVARLEETDQRRMELLQELSHDLRTPLASLRAMIEILADSDEQLPQGTKQNLLKDCQNEIEYFGRLTDDLLFLARVSEPKYQLSNETVDLAQVVSKIADNLSRSEIKCEVRTESGNYRLQGSSILVTRLIRNACENAMSFANSTVKIHLGNKNGSCVVKIEDDGPGLNAEQLINFGKKRFSRALDSKHANRLSIGLGSVIMQSIAQIHGGSLSIHNRKAGEKVQGATLEIYLPTGT